MIQLILHLLGDYVLQSDWMAREKTARLEVAGIHATFYALPFLLIGSWSAVSVIWFTHLFIDHYGVAKYLVWAKNHLAPRAEWREWRACKATGYPPSTPPWLAVWLLIVADNTLHLAINWTCLRWL